MGDRRERSAFGGFFTFLKFIFACTPHSCVLFLMFQTYALQCIFTCDMVFVSTRLDG